MRVLIEEIEKKVSSKGVPYATLVTSQGKLGVWDLDMLNGITVGDLAEVETSEKNGYVNVKSIKKHVGSVAAPEVFVPTKQAVSYSSSIKSDNMAVSVLTAYTKDIMCALIAKKENHTELDVMAREVSKVVWHVYSDFYKQISNSAQ